MIVATGTTGEPEGSLAEPRKKIFDLPLVLGMLSSDQIKGIAIRARQQGRLGVEAALNEYLSRRGRGRPRGDTFGEVDAWLIVWANELFRSGRAPSPWRAITCVVKGAWAVWDDGTPGGRRMQEIAVGNTVLRAPEGMLLSRQQVLGQSPNAIEQRCSRDFVLTNGSHHRYSATGTPSDFVCPIFTRTCRFTRL
jgi:hypothetical protein